jgi:hypothetical protein
MATITWNPADYGEWTNTLDWIGGIVPGAVDTAVIAFPSSTSDFVEIAAGTSIAVGNIVFSGSAAADLSVYGTLVVGVAATFEGGSLIVTPGAVLGGTIDLTGGQLIGSPYASGFGALDAVTVSGTARLSGSLSVIGGLVVQSATIDLSEAILQFAGTQTVQANVVLGFDASISGALTLAAGTTIDDTGATLTVAGGTLVNDGVILATALAGDSALANNGRITLDGTGTGPGYIGADLDNTGTILIENGATYAPTLHHNTDYFINDGLIVVGAGGVLSPEAFTLTITPTAAGTGTISLDAGGVLAVGVALSGGTILGSGGTIAPVEFGLTDMTIAGIVTILGGLDSSNLTLSGSAAVTLGPQVGEGLGSLTDTGTLTTGAGSTLAFGAAVLGSTVTAASLDLAGTIAALPGGTLTIQAATFNVLDFDLPIFGTLTNSGTIATAAGETLILAAAAFDNTGGVSVVAGATLDLAAPTNFAALESIDGTGLVVLESTLDATGETVTLDPGSLFGHLAFGSGAFVQGGTFVAGGLVPVISGTLSDTTWRGGLDLSNSPTVTVESGIAVTGTDGGPGLITMDGTSNVLTFLSVTTLDSVTVSLGNTLADPGNSDSGALVASGTGGLSFGAAAIVAIAGNLPTAGIFSDGPVGNSGTIAFVGTASGSGNIESVAAPSVENDGIISVAAAVVLFEATDSLPFEAFTDIGEFDTSHMFAGGIAGLLSRPVIAAPPAFVGAGSADFAGTITGSGTIVAGANGAVVLDGGAAASQTIAFDGNNAIVMLTHPAGVAAALVDFGAGDAIDLPLAAYRGGTPGYTDGRLSIPAGAGTTDLSVGLAAGVTASQLVLAEDEVGGTVVYIACFAEGTRISTPRGPVAVERLREGDTVVTASGEAQPVIWIGHRRVAPRRHPRPRDMQPVRIRASAFADCIPARDVRLSPDHAVLINGWLIPVRLLVNGVSVVHEDVAAVTYWHVELPRHDVLLAEGLPCESFLDAGTRGAFVGGGAALELHPAFGQRVWDGAACAPLALSGPAVEKARARLASRLRSFGAADASGVA